MNKTTPFRKALSMTLSIVMVLGMMPMTAFAETNAPSLGASGEIIAFADLQEAIANQTVPLGTSLEDLDLPGTLMATVQMEAETEIATPADGTESSIMDEDAVSEQTIPVPVTWVAEPDYDSETDGIYMFTSQVEGFTISAELPAITVTVLRGESTEPVVITAFDPNPYKNPDDPGTTYIVVDKGTAIADIPLPTTLAATVEGGEENAYTVAVERWACSQIYDETYQMTAGTYDSETAGIYLFAPILGLKAHESLNDNMTSPMVEVVVSENLPIMPMANKVWNSNTDLDVSNNDSVEIQAGAGGTLSVPANATVTVTSGGAVYNGSNQITLIIGTGARIIWTADYTGATANNLIRFSDNGTLEVRSGKIENIGSGITIRSIGTSSKVVVSGTGVVTTTAGTAIASSSSGTNAKVTVSGTGKVQVTGSGGLAINVLCAVEIKDNAEVTTRGDAIRANGNVTVRGNGKVQTTGASRVAIVTDSTVIIQDSAQVVATTGYAILANGASSTVTISGGLVFAYGSDITGSGNVIYLENNSGGFTDATGTGVVIAWKRTANTTYLRNSTTDIAKSPAGATAKWDTDSGDSGIAYANGSNTGFIPISPVTVSDATNVTFTAVQTGGTSGTANSTGIRLTFSEAVTGLTSSDITITNGTGLVTKGTLSGSGSTYTIALSSVAAEGNVTVDVGNFGLFNVTTTPQTVAVYKNSIASVAFTAIQTGGTSGITDSTGIVLTFSQPVTGLTASDITITNGTGAVTKGGLTGSGSTYTIAIPYVASEGNVNISVGNFGLFNVTTTPRTVAVYKNVIVPVSFTAVQIGGISGTADSTGIVLAFSQAVTGLTASDITVTNGTGIVTKGTLSGSGTTYTIALTDVATEGDITVSVANFGTFNVTTSPMNVSVYKNTTVPATNVTFTAVQTGGTSGAADSTGIVLTFDQAVTGLSASDITVIDGTGSVTKGILSGSGTTYTIALTGVATEGDVTVSVTNFGTFNVTTIPQTIMVYKDTTIPVSFTVAETGGTSGTANSTGIVLTFSQPITGLSASNITIINTTGSVTKGALTGSGTTWTIALSSVETEGAVTVSVANFGTFNVTTSLINVSVYKNTTVPTTSVTFTAAQTGGTSGTAASTGIVLTFDQAVTGLSESDITITGGTGSVTKGAFSGSGTTYTIALTGVATEGDVTVTIANFGTFNVTTASQTVAVYKNTTVPATNVTFTAVQTGGTSGTVDSTGIMLTFSQAVTGLSASDITITNSTGSVTKGLLTGSGTTWTIALSNVATQGNVTVSVGNFESFNVTTIPQTVTVYKDTTVPSTNVTFTAVQVGGSSGTAGSTGIVLTFDQAITGLTASDTTITNGTGSVTKGTLAGSGTTWTIALSSVANQGNVTVSVGNFGTFNVTTPPQTVAVYKHTGSDGNSSGTDSNGGSNNYGGVVSRWTVDIGKATNIPTAATQTLIDKPNQNGNLTMTITKKMVEDGIAAANGKWSGRESYGVSICFQNTADGTKSMIATIEATALDHLVALSVKSLTIQCGIYRITLDEEAIKSLDTQSSGNVTVTVTPYKVSSTAATAIGNRPVFEITFKDANDKEISSFGTGTITRGMKYSAPSGENSGSLFVIKVVNQTPEWLEKSGYDNGWMIWSGNSCSVYGIGYIAAPAFTDTQGHWAKDNIDFVVSRRLISGTTTTTFAPNTAITRADFLMALGKLSGADVSGYKASSFSDVATTNAAMSYIEWAYKNGIVSGTENSQFSPNATITREQMAVMMQNYAKVTDFTLSVSRQYNAFTDDAAINSWAKDAVKVIAQAGIIVGKDGGEFDPQGTATRAEAATILHRFVELVTDEGTARGWVKNDSGSWMYFDWQGRRTTGWFSITDTEIKYYFDKDGVMVSGKWVEIGGKWYYFYPDGNMARSSVVDGYTVGEDGARKDK